MKAHDFQQYLEQPTLLYNLPLASLQQLAMEYPYSPNLRLLLLLKTHLEGHPDEADYLNRCSAAAFDRAFIYDLLQDTRLEAKKEEREATEVLELRTLEEIALEEAAAMAAAPKSIPETEDSRSYESIFSFPEEEEPDQVPEPPATPMQVVATPAFPPDWADNAAAFMTLLPLAAGVPAASAPPAPQPEPVSKFAPGPPLSQAANLRDRLREIRQVQAGKLAGEQDEVRQIARRSLVAQEAVASETLAGLLVRQGQHQNAIKMYQRLSLLYPEKKSIFAGLIKDLKEKL